MRIYNVCMETFGLHGLTSCVSEGLLSKMLGIYNVYMETSDLHEMILCVSEDSASE